MSECIVPKDIIEVEVSYRKDTYFNHGGNDFIKGNRDWVIELEIVKDEQLTFCDNFTILLKNYNNNLMHEVTSEYYSYDETTKKITIDGSNFFVYEKGVFGIIVTNNNDKSYTAKYSVIESDIDNGYITPPPAFDGDYIQKIENENGEYYIAYDNKGVQVAKWSINGSGGDVDLSQIENDIDNLQTEVIALNTTTNDLSLNKANQTDLDLTNEKVFENTLLGTNNASRITALENAPGGGDGGITEESDPIYLADKPNIALKSELPDMDNYYTISKVDTELAKKANVEDVPDISNLATKDELSTIDTNVTAIQSEVNDININKADQTELDINAEHISENTAQIVDHETRLKALETATKSTKNEDMTKSILQSQIKDVEANTQKEATNLRKLYKDSYE